VEKRALYMFSVDTLLSADMQVIHAYDLSSLQVNAAKDLIRSDKVRSGFKGVREICDGQYQATCFTSPCVHNNLGATFGSREEAAQAYLRHWEKDHPEELEKERASRPPPSVHEHVVLIRSDKSQTGYKGVRLNGGPKQASQDRVDELSTDRSIEGRPSSLPTLQQPALEIITGGPPGLQDLVQHGSESIGRGQHHHNLNESCDACLKCGRKCDGRMNCANCVKAGGQCTYGFQDPAGPSHALRADLPDDTHSLFSRPDVTETSLKQGGSAGTDEREQLLIRSDRAKTGYKGVYKVEGGYGYRALCNTSPCSFNHLGCFDTPEESAQA
jgi:hypothetical protein